MGARSVLVTGGCGFVGRHAIPHLIERGYDVHVVAHSKGSEGYRDLSRTYSSQVRFHIVDLSDTDSIEPLVQSVKASHLLHLAWAMPPGEFWSSLGNLDWIVFTKILVKSFIENGGSRIVGTGTAAEYDWESGDEVFVEDTTPLVPSTFFGQAKLAARRSLFALAEQHSVSAAWGRLFFLFGPHESPDRLVTSAVRKLLRGEQVIAHSARQVRDIACVDDVASAFVSLLDSDVRGDLNLASGEARSVGSILSTIAAQLGCPDGIKSPPAHEEAAGPKRIVASVEKVRRELPLQPWRSFEDRLADTIEWNRTLLRNG